MQEYVLKNDDFLVSQTDEKGIILKEINIERKYKKGK